MTDLLRSALPAPDLELAQGLARPFRFHAALDALAAARRRPALAGPILSDWFRQNRKVGSTDRRFVQAGVYGIIRHEHFLRRVLGESAPDDARLLETLLVLAKGEPFLGLASEGPEADFATALSLPRAITDPWLATLGPTEAAHFAQVSAGRAPVVLRANRLRCTAASLAQRLQSEGIETHPVDGLADALSLKGTANLQLSPAFRDGWFEVQDAASQHFLAALGPLTGAHVLDLCAGAGGKSLGLAAMGARVQAWDLRPSALDEAARRAERAGARIRFAPPPQTGSTETGRGTYDLVVVDAPCSGTGRLRREPTLRWGLDLSRVLPVQAELVAQAARLVRPGGRIAYATCSLVAPENDPPVPSGLTLLSAELLWPHRHACDGFGWRIWQAP